MADVGKRVSIVLQTEVCMKEGGALQVKSKNGWNAIGRRSEPCVGVRLARGGVEHSPCEVALPFGQGGIASLPRDYKGGRSSPLSDAWARSDHQQRWRRPDLWAGRVTLGRECGVDCGWTVESEHWCV
jgi:hypothetical protein